MGYIEDKNELLKVSAMTINVIPIINHEEPPVGEYRSAGYSSKIEPESVDRVHAIDNNVLASHGFVREQHTNNIGGVLYWSISIYCIGEYWTHVPPLR